MLIFIQNFHGSVMYLILLLISFVFFYQVFSDGVEALRTSYKKMNPFSVPFATTSMGPAILAMDLVFYPTIFV